jgi:hypothetical protein
VSPAQDLEDALWSVLVDSTLDTATGVWLDRLGVIVGQARLSLSSDDVYREHLRARVAVNRSQGTFTDAYRVAELVIDDVAATYEIDNQGAAAYVLRVLDVIPSDDTSELLIGMLRDASAAGVRPLLEVLAEAEATSFHTAIAAFAPSTFLAGVTTLTVTSTEGFPDTGTLDIDEGRPNEDLGVTYTGRTATTFTGVSGVAQNHGSAPVPITLATGPGEGLGDDATPATGGAFVSVLE